MVLWVLSHINIYIVNLLIGVFIISIVPSIKTFLSNSGSKTLYAYLFHGFIIKYIVFKTTIYRDLNTFPQKLILIIAAILITFILSSDHFVKLAKFIVKPNLKSFFKEDNSII